MKYGRTAFWLGEVGEARRIVIILPEIPVIQEYHDTHREDEKHDAHDRPDQRIGDGLVAHQRIVRPVGGVGVFGPGSVGHRGPGQP